MKSLIACTFFLLSALSISTLMGQDPHSTSSREGQNRPCEIVPSLWNFEFKTGDEGDGTDTAFITKTSKRITDFFEIALLDNHFFSMGVIDRKTIKRLLDIRSFEIKLSDTFKERIPELSGSDIFINGSYTLQESRDQRVGEIVTHYEVLIETQGLDGRLFTKQYEILTQDELSNAKILTEKMNQLVNNMVINLRVKCGINNISSPGNSPTETPPTIEDKSNHRRPQPEIDRSRHQLPSLSIQLIQQEALKRAKELGDNFERIASKDKDIAQRLSLIDLTVDFFESADCKIEVSSKGRRTTRHYPVEDYLNRLSHLNYSKIYLTWVSVELEGNFAVDPNDPTRYHGRFKVVQEFRGLGHRIATIEPSGIDSEPEEVELYSDRTTKIIDATVRVDPVFRGTSVEDHIIVLFCDMKVKETE
ncbi:MAG: hypothetical protein AAF587_33215 [Bacteroidota bacterium]